MTEKDKATIAAARESFNAELLSADYHDIHGDAAQVARMIAWLAPKAGGHYLDLATGTGLVAFALARRHPAVRVTGIDIAERAIARNRAEAAAGGHDNLDFRLTDGRRLDFAAGALDGIAWRYALHHFPDPDATLADARRVLAPGGALVVADAIRHPDDREDFINRFQALKPDGHVEMHSGQALTRLIEAAGFRAEASDRSRLAFTRDLDRRYRDLIAATRPETHALYDLRVEGDRAALSFEILTVRFVAVG